MGDTILNITGLTKYYGTIQAVRNLDLEISRGQVYGILGPNGSGKSTTLGTILGIINPSGGHFQWFENELLSNALQRIGSIIESPSFYPYLSAEQNLQLVSEIRKAGKGTVNNVLQKVGLLERKKDPFKNFSFGMKQRLALAAALIGDPQVLVLDEPTNGMDPQGIADIRNLIVEIAHRGTTILLASHLLDEVQKTCTHVAVLNKGQKIFDGSVHDIVQAEEYLEIWAEEPERLLELLKNFKGIAELKQEIDKYIIKLGPGPTKKDLHKYLIDNGIYPTHFITRSGTLENKFLELLKTS